MWHFFNNKDDVLVRPISELVSGVSDANTRACPPVRSDFDVDLDDLRYTRLKKSGNAVMLRDTVVKIFQSEREGECPVLG